MFRRITTKRRIRVATATLMFLLMILMNSGLSLAFSGSPRAAQQAAPPQGAPPQGAPPQGASPQGGPGGPPAADKPFADVIKDAEVIKGLFTLYRKDEKTYLEILPEQMGKTYLISPTMESALGERGFFGAQVLEEFPFAFVKAGKNVQFIRKNVRYMAADKTPMNRAVARSFADSILGATKIESLPHPERKSVLIDLGNIMLADIPLIGFALEWAYRMPYRLDRGNSQVGMVKGFPENVEIDAALNFAVDRPPVPPPMPMPFPQASPPVAPPDVRSLQFRVRYSLSTMPQTAFRPRLADDRVGHFMAMYQDFSDDTKESPYVRYITRWNLEKADPSAGLSAPKQPIVFWLENTIPEKHRAAVAEGVLMWNKAFERIGFKDTIVVKQQPDDADWDPADVRYNTVRWFVATDAGFAIGPSRVNPLTGQIYDADIGFTENMTRGAYQEFDEFVNPIGNNLESEPGAQNPLFAKNPRYMCSYAEGGSRQMAFGHNLLEASGAFANGAAREQYVREFLIHVTAHEVGHTLGLRYNFRASTLHGVENLQDATATTEKGLTGSVMDYTPVNIAPEGQKQGQYWQTTLGPYDYWAIEYAYKPINAANPEAEKVELRKIASRVADPALAYGTDEDSFFPAATDPRTNQWDFGTDPLKYYPERIKLVHKLWKGLETKAAKQGEGYQPLRRGFNMGMGELRQALINTTKYIGATYHNRDHVGDPNGRSPYVPVPAADQRRALEILNTYAFGSDAFSFSPSLLNKLAIDRFWTFEGNFFGTPRLDYPIHQQIVSTHRMLLDRLHHPTMLARLQDLEVKYPNPRDTFTMADLFQGLQSSIWSELKSPRGAEINSFRRALQREHLKRLSNLVLRPAPNVPEDASTLARYTLTQLRSQMQQALAASAGQNVATRAHLQESLARIDETLKAQQQRVIN